MTYRLPSGEVQGQPVSGWLDFRRDFTDPAAFPWPRGAMRDGRSIDRATAQEALHRDGRLPDERAGQRAGRRSAARTGVRADRRHRPGRYDPLQHVLGPAARRGQDLQRAGADQAHQASASPRCRSACWDAWPRRIRSRSSSAHPHVDVVVGPGQLARVPELLVSCQGSGSPQLAVSLARDAGIARATITASFESYDADREPAMRPSPFQAFVRVMMGCDKFCTYCIVPSVRGPEQSRPPSRNPGRGPAACRPGSQGDHAPGTDGQQLQVSRARRADHPALRPALRIHDMPGIERIKFITSFPNDMTDDLLAGRPRSSRGLPDTSTSPRRAGATRSSGG